MPRKKDPFDFDGFDDEMFRKLREEEEKKHKVAVAALEFFIAKYSPADATNADVFFSTREISQAIEFHTGATLPSSEIYEMMTNNELPV